MGVNLLIVAADPVFRENLAKRLWDGKWKIRQAERIGEVRKIVKRSNIDVTLLGLTSLKQEGIAILKAVKKIRPLTEVITISGADQVTLSIEGMKRGAFDDFIGPFTIDSLAGRIRDACSKKRQREKAKKPLLHQAMDIMAAAAFAEAGEPEMALTFLKSAPLSASQKKRKETNMKQIKILLVDDEEEFVKPLAERIKLRELGSDIALNGEEALRIVKDQIPDVMVLDLKMPGIDGMEVLRRVKKEYPGVQVIILTGHGSEKDEQEARRLGAFDYLQKPVRIDDLVQYIKRAYKHKMESSMAAAAFAEAGDFDTAREILKEKKDK